jgi:hypothetical protein
LNHNELVVWYGDGAGGLHLSPQVPIPAGDSPRAVAPADYNNDGVMDLAAVNASDSTVTLLIGTIDSTPPTTTIALYPLSPDGSNDWYRTTPAATVTATDAGGGAVGATRCAVDPTSAPVTWDDLPGSCTLPDGPVVGSEGAHVIYAAAEDTYGNIGDIVSRTFQVDGSGPILDPAVSPDVIYQGSVATASPNASDSVSGVAAQSCDAVPTDIVGDHSVQCSATDNAGNLTSAGVNYSVLPAADVSVGIAAEVSPRSREITYSVTVANGGPSAATNVVLTDTLPSGSRLLRVDSTYGTCTPPAKKSTVLSCTLASLSAAHEAVVTIVVRMSGKRVTAHDVATVTSDTHDLDDSNNLATIDSSA